MTQLPPPTFLAMFSKYNNWWSSLTVVNQAEANKAAKVILASKARYQAVEALTTVPWYVIGLLHMRESNNNFHCWLHNGDPMFHHDGSPARTVQVPANRPPNPSVSWEVGAVDALQGFKLTTIKDWTAERTAYTAEAFNGWAYTLYHHIPSPYLFGGSSVQLRGKFVADHVWDSTAWDTQMGVMTVLKALMTMDKTITLIPSMVVAPTPPHIPVPSPVPAGTPKASPTSLPTLTPSRWAPLWAALAAIISALFRKK